jgi:hypothetical protein
MRGFDRKAETPLYKHFKISVRIYNFKLNDNPPLLQFPEHSQLIDARKAEQRPPGLRQRHRHPFRRVTLANLAHRRPNPILKFRQLGSGRDYRPRLRDQGGLQTVELFRQLSRFCVAQDQRPEEELGSA